jgi:hypothetical protein
LFDSFDDVWLVCKQQSLSFGIFPFFDAQVTAAEFSADSSVVISTELNFFLRQSSEKQVAPDPDGFPKVGARMVRLLFGRCDV